MEDDKMEAWRNFKQGVWCDEINVSNFIKLNYTQYDGDASFLAGPTERTNIEMKRVKELLIAEDKSVTIPAATTEQIGLVKLSAEIGVNESNALKINNVNVDKLTQSEGTTLVLNGGSAKAIQ